MAFMRPLVSTNITKAVDPLRQGVVSGWAITLQSISQIIAPLIATLFLDINNGMGITFELILIPPSPKLVYFTLNPYQLIGFTAAILGIILLTVGYIDLKKHPKLYSYEKIRRKREEIRRRKAKASKT
jgi:MFS family permease